MAMTERQVEAVVGAVLSKAESMVANRVNARNGSAADKRAVKNLIAARLIGK